MTDAWRHGLRNAGAATLKNGAVAALYYAGVSSGCSSSSWVAR